MHHGSITGTLPEVFQICKNLRRFLRPENPLPENPLKNPKGGIYVPALE
jgi:hypothetical protein